MAGHHPSGATQLILDELRADLGLARRLPADLARRFHAVPLAEDRGWITVAMADPDDLTARAAIASILGPAVCVVRADPAAIDTLVAQIWREEDWPPLDLVVCSSAQVVPGGLLDYSQAMAELLGARFSCLEAVDSLSLFPSAREGQKGKSKPMRDVLVVGEPDQAVVRRVLEGNTERAHISQSNVRSLAALAVQEPRWPIKKLLLILGGAADDSAIEWVMRLARPSQTTVAVVPLVLAAAELGQVTDLIPVRRGRDWNPALRGDTPLGRKVHIVGGFLRNRGIHGTLRLRQGPPDSQVRREVAEGDYDLIVASAHCPESGRSTQLCTDLTVSLITASERPVLIANLSPGAQYETG